jgi:predicted CXXCH cytochrome family protein
MATAGMTCQSCHQIKDVSASGSLLWKASAVVCIQCHDAAANERLLARHEQLKDTLSALDADLKRVRETITASNFEEPRNAEIMQRLRDLNDDLQFLQVGNSIHNMHYADSLSRALVENLRAICRELNIAEPNIELPTVSGAVE